MRELPVCDCGRNDFSNRSTSLGPGYYNATHRCQACQTLAWVLSSDAGMVCILVPPSLDVAPVERWVNDVLQPTWRDRSAKLKAHRKEEWAAWLDEVFKVRFPECTVFPDHSVSYHDLPKEAQEAIDLQFGENDEKRGTYRPLPPELLAPVYPPQVPEGVTVWFLDGRGPDARWVLAVHNVSAAITPPRDPILVSNERYFAEVWKEVEAALGCPLPDRVEVKNGYGGREPWYQFVVGTATFTVGWRKRVVSLQVESPTLLSTERIRPLASRDDTTYEAHRGDEGGWQSEIRTANVILIHAWTREKLVEYIVALYQTAQDV